MQQGVTEREVLQPERPGGLANLEAAVAEMAPASLAGSTGLGHTRWAKQPGAETCTTRSCDRTARFRAARSRGPLRSSPWL